MPHFYIEEDEIIGDIYICDGAGGEIIRFHGENALESALQWAKANDFELRSKLGQDELVDIYRLFFRRGLRRLRLFRTPHTPPKDPPNVQRIIVSDFERFFGDPDDSEYVSDPFEAPEEIELAPTTEEDERSENRLTRL
jgi:hypothetical protein